MRTSNGEWDVFISHASEDKEDFVRPLAEGLRALDLRVWYDELTLKIGDSLREAIDHGLGQSRFGIVVLSQHFFSKQWPQNELDGLLAREVDGLKVILPVWHKITRAQVEDFSPVLAGRVAARSEQGLDQVIEALMKVIGLSAIEPKPTASAGTPPEIPLPPATDTDGSSGDLAELASQIRKEVDGLAKPGEKWQVSDGDRISVSMFNPRNPGQGRGLEINSSNRDGIESVMESLRSEWADRHREDDEYARRLLKKEGEEGPSGGVMSDDTELCSVKIVPRPVTGKGPQPDPGTEVFIRAKVGGRIQTAWIDRKELISWKDELDDLSDKDLEEFVGRRAESFARIIELAVKERRPRDERGAIELTKVDLADVLT